MTLPGKLYVAPIDQSEWERKGWTEVGYTTDGSPLSMDLAEPTIITADGVRELKVPDLSGLSAAFMTMTPSVQGVLNSGALQLLAGLRPGHPFLAPGRQRPDRIRRMRSLYRSKRGRRRFR